MEMYNTIPKLILPEETIILIGSGPIRCQLFDVYLEQCLNIIAVDGGANVSLPSNKKFLFVIGDLDSIKEKKKNELLKNNVPIYKIKSQDNTDFEKALNLVEAKTILAFGFYGGRIDHTLASFNTLVKYSNKNIILFGETDVVFLPPEVFTIELPLETLIAFFPFSKVICNYCSGLKWSLQNMKLSPDKLVSTSNETSKKDIIVIFNKRKVLVTLPCELISTIVSL